MHKSEIDGEITGHDANQASDLSRSAARGTSVIPFVRRADAAASVVPAGAVETSSAAPFIPLGHLTQAVVMRLANDAVRLRVSSQSWEEDLDWDEL